jgi:16S rRNA (cytosine1402-N4)-methyltransferase
MSHIPVLLQEMITYLRPKADEVYLDATFGGGGYSKAILEAAPCQLVVLDRDPDAIKRAELLALQYPERITILQGSFVQLPNLWQQAFLPRLHGIVFDFGVSSYQIDEAQRGFSFRFDGPLDMRMSQEGISAADVVNEYSEKDLADIIYRYGEEPKSRQIARAIVNQRKIKPFESTLELANLVQQIIRNKPGGQHSATLTFQALRIFVNNELIELESGLKFAENYLEPGGRLVTVTFHSLEDRLVKTFLKQRSIRSKVSRLLPGEKNLRIDPTFQLVTPRGISPSETEARENPRSRSARLRSAVRLPDLGGQA